MNIGTLNSKPAEVNGTKIKSLRYRHVKRLINKREPSKDNFLTRLSKSFDGCFKRRFCGR